MIRNLLISILFFFGPMLLLFALRNAGLLIRLWLQTKQNKPEIIDITPQEAEPPSTTMIITALMIGVVLATLVWLRLGDEPEQKRTYIPAHLNQGSIVPGKYR